MTSNFPSYGNVEFDYYPWGSLLKSHIIKTVAKAGDEHR